MIINKITTGFVIQQYDTDLGQFINQKFIASCECEYEDQNGNYVKGDLIPHYLPYDMIQPKSRLNEQARKERMRTEFQKKKEFELYQRLKQQFEK